MTESREKKIGTPYVFFGVPSYVGGGAQIDGFLMAPFQLTPNGDKLYVDDGIVTYAPVQDGYREGLAWLAQMYSEGLINPESFTQDLANQVNVNESGEEAKIGAFLGLRPGFACDLSTEPNSKKWEQYQSLAPLTGPDGQCIAAWNPYEMYQTGMTFISSNCENPEIAFRFVDYLATEEGSMRSANGVEGVHWRQAESGELDMDGKQAKYTLLDADTTNQTWGQLCGLVPVSYTHLTLPTICKAAGGQADRLVSCLKRTREGQTAAGECFADSLYVRSRRLRDGAHQDHAAKRTEYGHGRIHHRYAGYRNRMGQL